MTAEAAARGSLVFVFRAASAFRLLRIVAARAAAAGSRVTLLHVAGKNAFFRDVEAEAARIGATAVALADRAEGEAPAGGTAPARGLKAWLARAALPALDHPRTALAAFAALSREVAAAEAVLRRVAATAVICSEDGISGDLAVLAAAARLGVPVVDVPYGDAGAEDLENDLARREAAGELIRPAGRVRWLLRLVAPAWLKKGRFAGATLHRPEMVMAMVAQAMPVRDPWIVHGGMSRVLCAENEVGLARYRREGIPEAKLRLTGSPYCDALLDGSAEDPAARAALRQPRKIAPGVTRILLSWPPSYHDTYRGRSEFADYGSMTLAVLRAIADLPGVALTISLHPACDPGLADALRQQGLAPVGDFVVSLIGRHDLFVTFFSSTIRWALAAGKPVINYDAYRLGLTTYDSAPGFVNVTTLAALSDMLLELSSSDRAYGDLAARQIADAERWGALDGRASERILAEIDRAASAGRRA